MKKIPQTFIFSIGLFLILAVLYYTYILFFQSSSGVNTQNVQEEVTVEELDEEIVASGYTDVSAEEAYVLIQENQDLIIIDVSSNYNEGHIPGAVNYYVGDGSLDSAIPNLDPYSMYLVYCHVDSASILGAEKLSEAGFSNVFRLKGNYTAWVEAGYPIETAK